MSSTESLAPLQRYQRDLAKEGFAPDAAQALAVEHLQRLYNDLLQRHNHQSRQQSSIYRLKNLLRKNQVEPVQGLYLWGGVGRGKTYLVDTFYESLPFEKKIRIHFHRFMQRVHRELQRLQGKKNPLEIIGRQFASEAEVVCFDEFFVSDITDAMILGGLMEQLLKRGVVLVATSNIVPSELYKNGLQRDRFLPAINLIQTHTQVVNVDSGVDYRLRVLERAEIYHYPLDPGADAELERCFRQLAPEEGSVGENIEIEGRLIATRRLADGVLWCDFSAVCDGPRSQNDYIELAREFHAVLISNVPKMGVSNDDQVRRFINLVDEFYDRNVKLIISAAVDIDDLYAGGRLEFEFQRTRSRLLEMQSHEYLARMHLA